MNTKNKINPKILEDFNIGTSIAQKELTCCIKWFDPKYKHTIPIGKTIYWKQINGRAMGHCENCIKDILAMYEVQGNLFESIR